MLKAIMFHVVGESKKFVDCSSGQKEGFEFMQS